VNGIGMTRWLQTAWHSDVAYSFRHSPVAMAAGLIAFACLFCAVFANWVAPHNPFDLATLELSDAFLPPLWLADGNPKYLLGTDDQGRDILSALMFGARISLMVGLASVMLSAAVGVSLGLLAGFVGGRLDAFIMRGVRCDAVLPRHSDRVVDCRCGPRIVSRCAVSHGVWRAGAFHFTVGLGAICTHCAQLDAG
jgi:ABC-type dipeptide/oligopeptide/nickel transport system permease subunit